MTFHHAKLDISIAGVKARRVMAQLPTLELFYKIVVRLTSCPIKSDVCLQYAGESTLDLTLRPIYELSCSKDLVNNTRV